MPNTRHCEEVSGNRQKTPLFTLELFGGGAKADWGSIDYFSVDDASILHPDF
jgi:hypothetical protein